MAAKKRRNPREIAEAVFRRETGAIGGKIGGKLRWKGISAAERSKAMRQVAAMRKRKGTKR